MRVGALAALLGLSGLAFGPFLELLSRHPEFLVAHQVSGLAVFAVAPALLLLPGLVAFGLALPASWLGAGRAAFAPAVAPLATLALLPALSRALPDSELLPLFAALVGGVAFALGWWRSAALRRFAALLLLAPLAFALQFHASPASGRLRAAAVPALPVAAPAAGEIPLVWVIFDELPLVSLLDGAGRIDPLRYPRFAELAGTSTWFANTTASAGITALALPGLLTGRHPDPERLPVAADHPNNLFTLLAGSYALHVEEPRTMLLPRELARGPGSVDVLAADLSILYLHFLLPPALTTGRLPPVHQDWLGFAGGAEGLRFLRRTQRLESRVRRFVRFVHEIGPCPGRCLHFLHTVLPHVPWEFSETGRLYPTWSFTPALRLTDKRWGPEERWVAEGQQRHLLQVDLVDRMLGSLLARLRREGLFDRALLVVTADHGVSFWPGEPSRSMVPDHPHREDLVLVPLFVKEPGQRTGRIDTRPVSAVDVLPSVAERLGFELPWPVDGRSFFAPVDGPREPRVSMAWKGTRVALPDDLYLRRASLERKLARFGPGEAGLFARGPHRALLGRSLGELGARRDPGLRIELARKSFLEEGRLPPRLIGRLALESGDGDAAPVVGAAVGGRIRALAPSVRIPGGPPVFSLFLPEAVVDAPLSKLRIFSVREGPAGLELRHGEIGVAEFYSDLPRQRWD